jgi:transposase InsO family protein
VKTAYIEPGSSWENGFCESFNGTFRDNLLDGEIFCSLKEAQIIVGEWVKHYNHVRLHSALGYKPTCTPNQRAPNDTKSTQVAAMIYYKNSLWSRN